MTMRVYLGIFAFPWPAPMALKPSSCFFQLLLNPAVHNKLIQNAAVFLHRMFFPGKAFCQDSHFLHKLFSALIKVLQLLRIALPR